MRIGRIPVSIHPLFWLFAGLIGYFYTGTLIGALVGVVVILVSVLVHELGHAVTGLLFKQQVHIQLVLFGGVTYRTGPKLSLPKEFLLTLNGPLAGYALAGVVYGIATVWSSPPPIVALALHFTFIINLFWSTINLLPVLPLDGGHLLRIVLEGIFGHRGTSIALMVGVVLGACFAILFFFIGFFIAGAIFFLLTFESFRGWMAYRNVTEADKSDEVQQLFRAAESARQVGAIDEALDKYELVRHRTQKGVFYSGATEAVARIIAERGQEDEAYEYLKSVEKHLSSETLPLFQRLAYRSGDYSKAVAVGKEVYQYRPDYQIAWICALAHAALNEVRPSVGWLECAVRDGMPDPHDAIQDHRFDAIRADPKFAAFTQQLSS